MPRIFNIYDRRPTHQSTGRCVIKLRSAGNFRRSASSYGRSGGQSDVANTTTSEVPRMLRCCKTRLTLKKSFIGLIMPLVSIATVTASDLETKCKEDASRFVAQKFPESPSVARSVTHMESHHNRRLSSCLVSVTLLPKLLPTMSSQEKEAHSKDVMQALITVSSNPRELAHVWSLDPSRPPVGCHIQSSQMQNQDCSSLAEYEAFVAKAMRE